MSNFKLKKNKVKKKVIKDNCTLDKKHREKINIFTLLTHSHFLKDLDAN